MKKACLLLVLAALLFCTSALADEAGVLTESELNQWLNNLLVSTVDVQPLNAPVGEDALTDDGYAFLYETATLYYDKPVLDGQSVLNAVAVTDGSLAMPRGVYLGVPADMLLTAYGWQNPTLQGDGEFAPLYTLNQLPDAAYWALAQRDDNGLQSVQCAIHVLAGEDRYTDAGILYTVENDAVTAIRVYGLSAFVTRAEVESNLTAVGGAAAGSVAAAGATQANGAEPFGAEDLQIGGANFLTLTETDAAALFGEPETESWAQDDGGGWLHTVTYPGASLLFALDENKKNARVESVSVTDESVAGPRGLAAGVTLEEAVALFRADGEGQTAGSAALLYGDGETPPYGTLETTGANATLRYAALVTDAQGKTLQVFLHLSFIQGRLVELMLYTL